MNEKHVQPNSDQLRRAAETKLACEQAPDVENHSTEALLHELQVLQIELQMQNENLRQAHMEMEASRDRYVDLYDFSPVSYLTLSSAGTISEVNLTAVGMFAEARLKLLNRRFTNFIVQQDIDRWRQYFLRVLRTVEQSNCELSLKRADGSHMDVELHTRRVENGSGGYAVRIALTDITERRRVEADLCLLSEIKGKRAAELVSQALNEKEKRAAELAIANTELSFQNDEKEKRAAELAIANTELSFQNDEKEKRAAELVIANTELSFQNDEKEKRAAELVIANTELNFQNDEKEKRAAELAIANTELSFQNDEKEKRAAELAIANTELNFQYTEKGMRAAELVIANTELIFQNNEKEKRAAELVIANNELTIAATVFESQEGMIVTDARNVILRVNYAFTDITGYSAEDTIGKTPALLSSGKHSKEFYATMWASLKRIGYWEGEIWNKRKNGELFPEHLCITVIKDKLGVITNYVATMNDITMSRKAADEIQQLAFYDVLTGLPNRRLLLERLKLALAYSVRTGNYGSIFFLDLDNFKVLNDTLGHDIGDLLLQAVAQRLESCVREGDTIARLGGDEFVIIINALSNQPVEAVAQALVVGKKILRELNLPYLLASYEYRSTPSIGANLFIGHEISIQELLKQSDIAMYQAKKAGRNTLQFFDPAMQEIIIKRAVMEAELQTALENRQFQLYYQVQMVSSGQALGAEALIRWIHPERGIVSPAHFIPLAEETGQILQIGHWVLDTACAQLAVWQKNDLTRHLTLSVNVSARQFHQDGFIGQVRQVLQQHAINPTKLKLEPTESILLDDIAEAVATMNALKELGVQFALDDFGTGFSSLQYLKILPLNQLKIDQSFVRDLVSGANDQAIVRTIIAMAHGLNLDVIAEGVETAEQLQILQQNGCNHFQGYLFGKPVPIEKFEQALRNE